MMNMWRRYAGFLCVCALTCVGAVAIAPPNAYAANSGGTQQMYRLYNRVSHEHLYTADANERDVLSRGDWTYEGVGWVAPVKSSTPVYRLYNPILGDHHYTTDANEVQVLTAHYNWRAEGTGWYSSDNKEVPVYRQFNPGLRVGSHNYTTDLNEYKVNNSRNGWQGEGIAWYAVEEGWQKGHDPIYVTMASPQLTDKNGKASDTFTIPSTTGVQYLVGGKVLAAGKYKVQDYFAYDSKHQAALNVVAKALQGYRLRGDTSWNASANGIATVAPKAVTFTDENGKANDTFTIPSAAGVQYKVNGKNIAAGTYKVSDYFTYDSKHQAAVKVTASAKNGYKLKGTSTWNNTFDGITSVKATAVTFTDENGKAKDTFTIPSKAGVQYKVNGKNIAAGTYKVSDYFTYDSSYKAAASVSAVAKNGYKLTGTKQWANTFDGITTVTPKAVTFTDENGKAKDTFTIPSQAGVQYKVNGTNIAAGTYKVSDYFTYTNYSANAKVTAAAKKGYKLSGTSSWAKKISGITTVTPKAVTFTDENGKAKDTFTIPSQAGVQYKVSGKNIAAGTYKVRDYFTYNAKHQATAKVTAVAKAGYALSGTKAWSKDIDGITTVTPKAVTFTDKNAQANDTFTIPNQAGVQYKVNGKNIAAGTYKVRDYFTYTNYWATAKVTAVAKDGYKLSGTTTWNKKIDGRTEATPKAVTFTDKNGQANDTFTIPNVTGVQYKVNGKNIAAGTYKVGDYFTYKDYMAAAKVTASAKAGYKFTSGATTTWQKSIDGYTTVTPSAPTFKDVEGKNSDTYTIPSKAGVQYTVNGANSKAGTFTVGTRNADGTATVNVVAKPQAGYKLSGTTSWSGTYTAIVSPAEVMFYDPNGQNADTVTIPNVEGIYYTIDGVRYNPGTYTVPTQIGAYSNHHRHMSVHAYAEDGYQLKAGSTEYYFHEFTDGQNVTPTYTSTSSNDFGPYTTAQAQARIESYANNLSSQISAGSDYAKRTTFGDLYGQGNSISSRVYSDPEKEINRRFQLRFLQRTNELRATVGIGEMPLMRLSESDEAEMFAHAVYTQDMCDSQGCGHYTDDSHLVGVFNRTVNSGNGMGFDGTQYNGPAENLAWNYASESRTPEEMADRMILQYINEYRYLVNKQGETGHLTTLLRDHTRAFSAFLYVHRASGYAITAENYSW